jgi:CBS domain-containing protein
MKVSDVMSTKVVSVGPETPARKVAETLLKHRISAVPVLDADGAPIGIISEGDLMPRDETERDSRRDWWLRMLSQGQDVSPDYLKSLSDDRSAREVMIAPVITIDANADLVEVAELLSSKRIKRVPAMRDGKLVGIVSRADLVRAFAQSARPGDAEPVFADGSEWPVASAKLQELGKKNAAPVTPHPAIETSFSAAAFHNLSVHHDEDEALHRLEEQHRAEEKHHKEAQQFLATHLTEEAWQRMLSGARATAMKGEEEHLLLRFPCEVCSDHGRAINAPDPSWPETLRGMAAEIFLRWKSELRPHGFALHARVVEFPNGVPGDVGLFLAW